MPRLKEEDYAMNTAAVKSDETVRVVKSIDEHPLVIGLRAEIEQLKRAKFELGEQHHAAIRQRDEKYVADGVALRRQILSLQNEIAGLQDKLLAIRNAAL
jgi:hypothetical protein